MKLKLEIDLENDAFTVGDGYWRDGIELGRILGHLAKDFNHRAEISREQGRLRDVNGNTCGHWQITEEN